MIAEGGENKKRPMSIENGKWKIGTATENDYDIGEIVTDLTLETKCKGKPMKNDLPFTEERWNYDTIKLRCQKKFVTCTN